MTRRTFPRAGDGTGTALARGRVVARAGAYGALDVLHPLITLVRGLGRLVMLAVRWWIRTPKDRRGPALFLAAVGILVVALLSWGPAFALVALLGAAAWQGRKPAGDRAEAELDEAENARLQAVYAALVPFFALPDDPDPEPLFAFDGDWERAFEEIEFTEEGRIERLLLRYPAHFRDGDPDSRLPVERLLSAKSGRGREYRFDWDEEHNRLEMTVPEPLPEGIHAQRFVTGPGEIVLGFTDAASVQRTVPVTHGGRARDVPPVVWRTGGRSTESHLLAVGAPGAGTSTLLRSVALQALQHGDVLLVDGGGSGEFAALAGRSGVLAVETSVVGALSSVEWAAHETERRLSAASRAQQTGRTVGEDDRRPLWVVLDRPAVLSHLARTAGRRDPQELLQVPLRHGRAANVTVVVAEHFEGLDGLGQAVLAYARARVLLGAATPEEARAVLGEATLAPAGPGSPPGRGCARLGAGPVLRLQVPATPDPFDEAAGETERRAVLGLLPERTASNGTAAGPYAPSHPQAHPVVRAPVRTTVKQPTHETPAAPAP